MGGVPVQLCGRDPRSRNWNWLGPTSAGCDGTCALHTCSAVFVPDVPLDRGCRCEVPVCQAVACLSCQTGFPLPLCTSER
jgi:hypothetical protein